MGSQAQRRESEQSRRSLDAWLHAGGMVIAASERAARALRQAYHDRRRAEGLQAWAAPRIVAWPVWLHDAWQQYARDGRLVLNAAQERTLWAQIAGHEQYLATLLPQPLERLAEMAMEAHALLCGFAPHLLHPQARAGWQQDAGAFSGWLIEFDKIAQREQLISASRIAVELPAALIADSSPRASLLLAGFDRLLPAQRAILDAWGQWKLADAPPRAEQALFFEAPNNTAELEACALWCRQQLEENPEAKLLVLCSNVSAQRGEMERIFRRLAGTPFEFTLGMPLAQTPLVRSALITLRWLGGALTESEVDWLLYAGYTADGDESIALQKQMLRMRQKGTAQMEWSLQSFTSSSAAAERLPRAWVERMLQAQRNLQQTARRMQPPREWAELVPQLLQDAGWPGTRTLSSAEIQMKRAWEFALDQCATLGFDGRRMEWSAFLPLLERVARESVFAPESLNAPIQIAGPAESAGLEADALWFLGADQTSWPSAGSTHPFLPLAVQREHAMPHATAQQEWQLAQQVTERVLRSAQRICLSYARINEDGELRPSSLVADLLGPPQPLPADLHAAPQAPCATVEVADASRIPLPPGPIRGGAAALTAQSQCPFKAFATVRLKAQTWEPAEAGLTASERGKLLHAVLGAVWAGPPNGLRSLDDLLALNDVRGFVRQHVQRALQAELTHDQRQRMPQRYLDLEATRLAGLVAEWLAYEAARPRFTVQHVEHRNDDVRVDGLTLSLRADRIDVLGDGSQLVVDYKTGAVTAKSWELPRPDDVQLPLYAGFALDPNADVAGLVFARIRAGEQQFAGAVRSADALLPRDAEGYRSLAKRPLGDEQLADWRTSIERLARAFLAGDAEVDPREYPKTCEHCELQSLCRVQEFPPGLSEDDSDAEEAGDE